MRILFIADGRSPTAQSWIKHFAGSAKHEIHLASTFPCDPLPGLTSFHIVPVAFSGAVTKDSAAGRGLRAGLPTSLRTPLRNLLGPLTLGKAVPRLQAIVDEVHLDLIHAMRVPYEGMLAASLNTAVPIAISIWGNDFTYHARSNPLMAAGTRRAMRNADALLSDTQRDQRLGHEWGLRAGVPGLVVPGNGGVRGEIFYPAPQPSSEPRVVNPRGLRANIRTEVFFRAVANVVAQMPQVIFDCPVMQGENEAERWVAKLSLQANVNLLPKLSAPDFADLYRRAQVMVSPTDHDGTPNSLLEAMACGVFPVCGNIESIREWILNGDNGLLADPHDADALAAAILAALANPALRQSAARKNVAVIAERAEFTTNMRKVEEFYTTIANV